MDKRTEGNDESLLEELENDSLDKELENDSLISHTTYTIILCA
jgi:hypothetical protein